MPCCAMLNLPMSAFSHFFLRVHLRSRILPMTKFGRDQNSQFTKMQVVI